MVPPGTQQVPRACYTTTGASRVCDTGVTFVNFPWRTAHGGLRLL
jgi:hypothetical protein